MNIQKLQKLIQQGESHCLEFKKSTAQIKPAFETVCAFLNGKGGYVLFGVKDNGELIGQQVSDNTKQDIANEIRKIEPNAPIEIHYVHLENHHQIIVLEVQAGKYAPYTYDGRSFERTTSSTSRMTQHHYEQLIIKRGHQNHAWDKDYAENYSMDDLDHNEIRLMIQDGIDQNRISSEVIHYSIDRILNQLELMCDEKITNAAVVLFAKKMSLDFFQCTIKMARFRGKDKTGDFIDNQRFSGNAFQIIRAADAFAARHLPIASHFEPGQIKRIDQPAVPNRALREALINAISHRDYTAYTSTISLAIYDDRLELWNAGTLPNRLKLEDLRSSHDSHPRNKQIAMAFYERGWIEMWGTGTTRMIEFCRKNGTPEPAFREYAGGFAVIFPFKEVMNTEATAQSNLHHIRLTPRQEEIISILKGTVELSGAQIHEQLHVKIPMRTLQYELNKLKKLGLISSKGHAKSFVWSLMT
jgi:ATP-dependent DNA helicase RecG